MVAPPHTEGNTEQVTEEEKWEFLWFSEHKGFILGGGGGERCQTDRKEEDDDDGGKEERWTPLIGSERWTRSKVRL